MGDSKMIWRDRWAKKDKSKGYGEILLKKEDGKLSENGDDVAMWSELWNIYEIQSISKKENW